MGLKVHLTDSEQVKAVCAVILFEHGFWTFCFNF